MADERASLFTSVAVAGGADYVPILVETSPGTFANRKVAVAAFQASIGEPVGVQAYALAVTGTNAAATAQSTANSALASAGAAQLAANSAQGTANTALSTANSAFSIAIIGTNAASAAQGAANTAESNAQTAQSTASSAFSVAVAGTNAAATAQSTADAGYALAQIGTNTGTAAYTLAQTGDSTANSAFVLAQIGTNTGTAAYNLAAAALPTTGGTLTGNLYVPNTVFGVGTVPLSSGVNGTIQYDFAGSVYQQTTASGTIQVTAKNYRPGVTICAILASDGTQRAVGYDSTFAWFGTQIPYTSTTSGKQIIVTMTSTGNTASGILAATAAQL